MSTEGGWFDECPISKFLRQRRARALMRNSAVDLNLNHEGLKNTTCWSLRSNSGAPDDDDVDANNSIRHSPRMHSKFQQRFWDSNNMRHSMNAKQRETASWANFRANTVQAFFGNGQAPSMPKELRLTSVAKAEDADREDMETYFTRADA